MRTIQTIGKSHPLKPVSLRLMCKLWEKQNRVFPHLQRLLNVDDTQLGIEMDLEIQISKAACVLDICKTRYGHCVNLISQNELSLKKPQMSFVTVFFYN